MVGQLDEVSASGVSARPGLLGHVGWPVIVSADQPLTYGRLTEVAMLPALLESIAAARPEAVVIHSGPIRAGLWPRPSGVRLVVHLSASSGLADSSWASAELRCTVEEAARQGADGVSVCISVTADVERTRSSFSVLSRLAMDCSRHGLSLLVMLTGRAADADRRRLLLSAVRAASYHGAEAVRLTPSGGHSWFQRLMDSCDVPVLIGVPAGDSQSVIEATAAAFDLGASGIILGTATCEFSGLGALVAAARAAPRGRVEQAAQLRASENVADRNPRDLAS